MISIKIDNRESKLKECFKNQDIYKPEFENLTHGDIQFIIDTKTILLFERKTISDLVSSIKDGRYKNQKSILFQSGFESSQIYYIIEGDVKWNSTYKDSAQIKGAIINTLLRDKIGIFYTKNIEDTYGLMLEIANRLAKEPSNYIHIKSEDKTERQIITLTQCDKNTPNICFKNMLCQIPNINDKTADAIIDTFKTMKQLILTLSSLPSYEEQFNKCSLIKISGRKISSKAITNLINYILV